MLIAQQRFHINRTSPFNHGYRFDLYFQYQPDPISNPGSYTATFCGSLFFGENIFYTAHPSGQPAQFFTQGHLVNVVALGTDSFSDQFGLATISQYDSMNLYFFSGTSTFQGTFFLPAISMTDGATTSLFFGTYGGISGRIPPVGSRTWYDAAYATIACGTLSIRGFTGSSEMTDARLQSNKKIMFDSFPLYEGFMQNPKIYPVSIIPTSDI
jgi:hypothetical protein